MPERGSAAPRPRPHPPLGCLLAACALLLCGCAAEKAPAFHAIPVQGAAWGRDFALPDQHGVLRRLTDFRGQVVVLFFGYTQCPDVCPTTLAEMRSLLTLLGSDAPRVQVLFVTLDPQRDSPAVLAEYMASFHPSFLALRGDAEQTAATAREFKAFYSRVEGARPNSYSIDHSASSYVFDPAGQLRLVAAYQEAPQRLAEDIRQLLAGR